MIPPEHDGPDTRAYVLERDALDTLIQALRDDGREVIAPVRRDGALIYDAVESTEQLPAGWTDVHAAGAYRLERRDDDALFGYTVGPHSVKRFLFPPTQRLWQARLTEQGLTFVPDETPTPRYAFLGVRACEIAAMQVQDRVLVDSDFADPTYAARREAAFIVAVQCGQAADTCFCVSMNTGPRARQGFDLALTEILDDARHHFLLEVGSERGAALLPALPLREATAAERADADAVSQRAAAQMGRAMETEGLRSLLLQHADSPHWQTLESRCLSCTNCTLVCPTCFCTNVDDLTSLDGAEAERVRRWDSCFTLDFSYLHGGSVRRSGASRYRQWITHKLATWHDQFEQSGCVGCGRCITWCPVGIDITAEVAALRQLDDARDASAPIA